MTHVDCSSRYAILIIDNYSVDITLCIKQNKDENITKNRQSLEKEESKEFQLRTKNQYKLLFYVPENIESAVM